MPREMERLGLAGRPREREREMERRERRGEGERGMVTVFGKGSREGR